MTYQNARKLFFLHASEGRMPVPGRRISVLSWTRFQLLGYQSFSLCCALLLPQSLFSLLAQSLAGLQCLAEVASPLCVNSALIQELFYAVKGTCDKEKEEG